jgi:uncharacterized protein YciI
VSLFAVTREAGRGWAPGGVFDQPAVDEHAAFMSSLADDGFVLFAGPLAGSERGRVRVLLIADGANEDAIHIRLADDPWAKTGQLRVVSVEPWNLFVGAQLAERYRSAPSA